jgi:pimeloyl-ACP methyl ester carboxylesterase
MDTVSSISFRRPDFRHGFVHTDVPIHYTEVNSAGPPLVLLHGIGMDWRVWQAVSRRLAPHFHLYLFDLRGHGESGKPPTGYTLAHYAADIEDALEILQLRTVTLLGSSLGGAVAVAVEAPSELVSARVLVDPPLTGGPIRDEGMLRDILALKHESGHRLAHYLRGQNPGAGSHLLTSMAEMWRNAADGVITDMLAHPADYYALESNLRNIESPTLLMQADPDMGAVLTDGEADGALQALSQGSVVRVRGAGHAVHAYKPAEFTRLVVEFAASGSVHDSLGAVEIPASRPHPDHLQ